MNKCTICGSKTEGANKTCCDICKKRHIAERSRAYRCIHNHVAFLEGQNWMTCAEDTHTNIKRLYAMDQYAFNKIKNLKCSQCKVFEE